MEKEAHSWNNELMDLGNHHQWSLVTSQNIETIRYYMPLDKKNNNTIYKVVLQTNKKLSDQYK